MISKTALHALKALVELAQRPNEFQGAASVAERIGAPQNYLGKLLQTMAQEGLVFSQKGLGGGFQLAKKPSEIRLMDVVEAIDHVSRWAGCFMGRDRCSESTPCSLHARWAKVRREYLAMLREVTLEEVTEASGTLDAKSH